MEIVVSQNEQLQISPRISSGYKSIISLDIFPLKTPVFTHTLISLGTVEISQLSPVVSETIGLLR